jgi:short-subunit dehydrogenase
LINFYKNKNIVITGAAGGLGKELTTQLHALGAKICCIVSPTSDIKDIIHYSDNISRCDLSSQEKTEEFLQSKIFDDVDILINCAGIFFLKNITKTTKKDYNLMMNVNLFSSFSFSLRCSQSMINKKAGLIINIGSSSCYNGCSDTAVYSISKHALLGMSRSLSEELKKHNINVLMFNPGSIKTKMGYLDTRQNVNTFLDPKKTAEYIIFSSSLCDDMIVHESRLLRKSNV